VRIHPPPPHHAKFIEPDPICSLPVMDSPHGTPRHSLLLLRLGACSGWPRILQPHCPLPSPPCLHSRPIFRYLPWRPNRIGRCSWSHRFRSLVGREYVGPSWRRHVWRLLHRNSLGRGVAVRHGTRISFCRYVVPRSPCQPENVVG
jgi:hypothetical protein